VRQARLERRPFEIVARDSRFGRTTVDIRCPFCGAVVIAYVWSLAGSGKNCPCGAKHTSHDTRKLVEVAS
jgi:hypothetical protein